MSNWLKENWLFIVLPIILMIIAITVLIVMAEGDPSTGFQYNI